MAEFAIVDFLASFTTPMLMLDLVPIFISNYFWCIISKLLSCSSILENDIFKAFLSLRMIVIWILLHRQTNAICMCACVLIEVKHHSAFDHYHCQKQKIKGGMGFYLAIGCHVDTLCLLFAFHVSWEQYSLCKNQNICF